MINLSLIGSECYSGAGHNTLDADDPSDGLLTDVPEPDAAWLEEMADYVFGGDAAPVAVVAVNDRVEEGGAVAEPVPGEAAKEAPVNLQGKKKRTTKGTVAARGSKRQRSPLGPNETTSGGSNQGAGSDAMYDHQMPLATGMKVAGCGRRRRKKEDPGSVSWEWEWDKEVGLASYPALQFWLLFHMLPRTFDSLCKLLARVVGRDETKRHPRER